VSTPRPSFHPGDDPYLYVQQLAVWQRLNTPHMAVSGDTKGDKQYANDLAFESAALLHALKYATT
jgi:hypothetical protein